MRQLYCPILIVCLFTLNGSRIYSQQMTMKNITTASKETDIIANIPDKTSLSSPDYQSIVSGYKPTIEDAQASVLALKSSLLLNESTDNIRGNYSENYELIRPLLRELYLLGDKSLPIIFTCFDEKVYLYSHTGQGMANLERFEHTLGGEAEEIFMHIVDPLYSSRNLYRVGKDGRAYKCLNYFDYQIDLKEWWHKRSSKSLSDIQKEVIEWHLQHENQIGYVSEDEKKIIQNSIESIKNGPLPWLKADVYTNPIKQIPPPL